MTDGRPPTFGRSLQVPLAVLSGLALAAAFPGWNVTALAWVALAPLLIAVHDQPPRRAFLLGWIAGLTFNLGTGWWLAATLGRYTDLPWAAGPGLVAVAAALLACYTAAFASGLAWVVARGRSLAWVAAALWAAIEWLRGWLPLGMPWLPLGSSQHGFLPAVQIAEVSGVYGVSAALVLANAALAALLIGLRGGGVRRWRLAIATPAVVVAAVLIGGQWRRAQVRAWPTTGALRVAIVQGNVMEERKWDPAYADESLNGHLALSEQALSADPNLVVWPETATPFFFQDPGVRRARLLALASERRVALLFGSPAWGTSGEQPYQTNRAYLIGADGTVAGQYDKLRLVPFGEYVPLAPLLFFLRPLVPAAAPLIAGDAEVVFALPSARFATLICYEAALPDAARRLAGAGRVDFLVNLTNDAWFPYRAAREQHLLQAAMRAVELRMPLVRVANSGISAVIDPDGTLRWRGPIDEPLWHVAEIRWPGMRTLYARIGDLFAWLCASGVLIAAILPPAGETLRGRGGDARSHPHPSAPL